jgi:tetratricopeptide (TPR) repeat protein
MPLAIELAASWVRLLSCAEIAREIAQSLDILTTAWRDVPQRHRSIEAVLDHSWKLLDAAEQDVFRRLTVFSGSFGREAAAAVADASLTMLLALVDKSFLRRTDPDRFGIHELIKQFGGGKLQADPEIWATTRLRHCRYFATYLVERMSVQDASGHLDDVEILFDDIQMAWRHAVENCHLVQIQELAQGFLVYYGLHSWYRAGSGALALYQQALACFDPDTQDPDQQAALSYLYESVGSLQKLATAYEAALAAFHKALEMTVDHDHIRRGRLHRKLAYVWVAMNQHEHGHAGYVLSETELAHAPQRVAAWWHEWLRTKMQRMELYYWQNRQDEMTDLARQIRPVIEEHGSVAQRVRYLYLLGITALQRDRYYYSSDARTYAGEALALSLKTGNLAEIAYGHFSYGFAHLCSDNFDTAETHLQITREMTQQNGDFSLLARALTSLTLVYRKQGDSERVREFAAQTLRVAGEAKMPQYTGTAHAHLAWRAWRAGDMAETKRQAWKAIEEWGGLGEAQSVVAYRWYVLFPLLGVALQEENIADAVQWAEHMIESSQFRLPDDLAALLARAVAARENGQENEARELLRQALQLAHDLHYI